MMDMKRVDNIKTNVIREVLDDNQLYHLVNEDDFEFLIQTIKQQQEALSGLAKLNEYLQSHPELSNNRIGDSVSLIAIDALERQKEQIKHMSHYLTCIKKNGELSTDRQLKDNVAYSLACQALGDTHE